jgi:hypothetical protein
MACSGSSSRIEPASAANVASPDAAEVRIAVARSPSRDTAPLVTSVRVASARSAAAACARSAERRSWCAMVSAAASVASSTAHTITGVKALAPVSRRHRRACGVVPAGMPR